MFLKLKKKKKTNFKKYEKIIRRCEKVKFNFIGWNEIK